MKFLLKSIIIFGFILILGSAGSADAGNIEFGRIVLNTVLGFILLLGGTSAHLHYNRYLAKKARRQRLLRQKRARNGNAVTVD